MRILLMAAFLLGVGRLSAQDASPYVPLHHWATAYVEHLIARGVMVDPSPLTRPVRRDDLRRALEAVDTLHLGAGERAVVRRIVRELAVRERGPTVRVDGDVTVAMASHARRDPLREAGAGHATAAGGLAAQLRFGPVVAVTHPYFDSRLKYDPDYQGKKDRVVAGRNAEAYASLQWRYGELFFGALDRNWGPPALEGLLVSPAPYSYDHFGISLGTSGVRVEGILTQLDDLPDSTGVPNHRYLVAHRLVLRPPGPTTISLWEGNLLAGPDRPLEPWYANILTLGLLSQYDQGVRTNSLLGADIQTRVGRITAFGSLLIDDIQIDRSAPGDQEPTSYGLTLGARGGAGNASWTAFYTQVANLTYRTPNPVETVMRRGVGLARNFADYDQLTLRASVVTGPGVLLSPEATLLRQGKGDFRLPYPPVAAYDSTPVFLQGVVERTVRLALEARIEGPRWGFHGDGGLHLIHNAGHVSGDARTRWVGRVELTWRFRKESLLP
ncbi:MAG: hypothetical protein HYS40_04575 [Gemmatimonadetes bacterium]|nr:hypothetical protein [Gemmatimonadota bacterium]